MNRDKWKFITRLDREAALVANTNGCIIVYHITKEFAGHRRCKASSLRARERLGLRKLPVKLFISASVVFAELLLSLIAKYWQFKIFLNEWKSRMIVKKVSRLE